MVIDFAAERQNRLARAERARLAARITKLQARQRDRVQAVAQQKAALDASVERAEVEIANLQALLNRGES